LVAKGAGHKAWRFAGALNPRTADCNEEFGGAANLRFDVSVRADFGPTLRENG
jgi:hypothetical protein